MGEKMEEIFVCCPNSNHSKRWFKLKECKKLQNTSNGFDYYCPKCGMLVAYSREQTPISG